MVTGRTKSSRLAKDRKTTWGQVRRMLAVPACVRCRFAPADECVAWDLHRRGVTVEQLQRAIWLGGARKYSAMLNGQARMLISSRRYFLGLIDEVREVTTPDSYWEHVRQRTEQLERQWLQRNNPAGAARLG